MLVNVTCIIVNNFKSYLLPQLSTSKYPPFFAAPSSRNHSGSVGKFGKTDALSDTSCGSDM